MTTMTSFVFRGYVIRGHAASTSIVWTLCLVAPSPHVRGLGRHLAKLLCLTAPAKPSSTPARQGPGLSRPAHLPGRYPWVPFVNTLWNRRITQLRLAQIPVSQNCEMWQNGYCLRPLSSEVVCFTSIDAGRIKCPSFTLVTKNVSFSPIDIRHQGIL